MVLHMTFLGSMTRRPRLLLIALFCLAPVLIGVTLRHDETTWLVPAGLLPFFLLGPTQIIPWSVLTAAVFWIGLGVLSAVAKNVEWQGKWRTVRGLALLSLIGVPLVVGSLTMMVRQQGILTPSWSGAAAIAWEIFLLSLTRSLTAASPGSVFLLRLWLLCTLAPSLFAFAMGTLAGLCC
jgi:hypothetical protein